MYTVILALHNIMRWVVVILAIVALARAYRGWLGRREWTEADRKAGVFFGIGMDIQLLLGLILYFFLSPTTTAALRDFGAAMSNDQARFFALEHILYMFVAVVVVHIGSVMARRAKEPVARHRLAAIWFSLAALILVIAIPWWRPLFPGL